MNENMSQAVDFSTLNIEIPNIIQSYSIEKQKEIFEYLQSMDEHNKRAYLIAFQHLGSSFNIYRSNGFKEWKQSQKL
jgi:hypothetical protein